MTDQVHKWTDDQLEALEKKIHATYAQAEREMKKKSAEYLKEYGKELKKKEADLKAGRISAEDFKRWKEEATLGAQWHTNMVNTLSQDLLRVDQKAMDIINGTTSHIYAENFNWGTYEIEHGTKMNTVFTPYDQDTVNRLLREDPNLLPQATLNKAKDLAWNRQHLTSAITQGILQGESIENIAKRLQSVVGMDERSSIRNARTATTAAENAGRIDSYDRAKEMGIELKKEWLATLDGRTRHSHRQLDGVAIEVDEEFLPGLSYPGDPHGQAWEVYNCRCTLVANLSDVDTSDAKRNSKLGKMSYEDWKNEKMGNAKTNAPESKVLHASYDDIKNAILSRYGEEGLDRFTREFAHYQGDASTGYATGVDAIPYVSKILDSLDEVKINTNDIIYRGIKLNESNIDKFLAENAVGNKITMRSLSWTTSQDVASDYANGVIQVIYENVTPGKKNAVSMMEWERHEATKRVGKSAGDFIASQQEVIQTDPNLEFEVVEIIKNGNKYIIKVKEIKR